MAGSDRGVPGPAAGHRRHAGGHAARGQHPAGAGAGAVRPARLRRLPQGRGRQPDRLVQGPGHDHRGVQGGRGRRQGDHLRLHRQHQRLRRGVRGPGRDDLRGAGAAGQDRAGQAGPGAGARREAAPGQRQLRRLPRAGREARPGLPGRAGQLGQPRPAARAEDGRLRDRRGARRRARHPLPAGRQRRQHLRVLDGLLGGPARPATPPAPRRCTASRPPAPPRS